MITESCALDIIDAGLSTTTATEQLSAHCSSEPLMFVDTCGNRLPSSAPELKPHLVLVRQGMTVVRMPQMIAYASVHSGRPSGVSNAH